MVGNGNIGADKRIVGRVTNGTTVTHYVISEASKQFETRAIPKNVVEQLALNGKISNCTAQNYKGRIILKGARCELNKMQRYIIKEDGSLQAVKKKEQVKAGNEPSLLLTAKYVSGRRIQAYKILDVSTNKSQVATKDDTLRLARDGAIINATCQKNGNTFVLRAKPGCSLEDLRIIDTSTLVTRG